MSKCLKKYTVACVKLNILIHPIFGLAMPLRMQVFKRLFHLGKIGFLVDKR